MEHNGTSMQNGAHSSSALSHPAHMGESDESSRKWGEDGGGGEDYKSHNNRRGGLSGRSGGMKEEGGGGGENGHKAKKMKIYKKMCEKAIDRMSALFGQSVEPHEMTKALVLAMKNGSPEEIVSAIEIFSDYRWAVNEKKELGEELGDFDEE